MHEQDETSLLRLLGTDAVPEDLARECDLRTRMYHIDGNSGPLRTVALIDMVRSMGYGPKLAEPPPQRVEWRDHRVGTRVEAHYFGAWQPGEFLGFCDSGTLNVKLDDDDEVKECRPHMVRLEAGGAADDEPPPGSILEGPLPVDEDDEGPPWTEQPEDFSPEEETDAEPVAPEEPDWGSMEAGTAVRLNEGDGEKDAVFQKTLKKGIRVLVDGEEESRVVATESLSLGSTETKSLAGVE